MIRTVATLAWVTLSLLATDADAQSERHRATRLGNPETRFAPPLATPDDLRRTLLSEALREDVRHVARMSGFNGDMEDFRQAAASAPIKEIRIPVGAVMSAMSTRTKGRVDLLRNVVWAGKQPIDAYEFSFISAERRYRVVTPKACSNFWVEEQLPRPKAELALKCTAPAESAGDAMVELCCTLTNVGELPEPHAVIALPFPAGAKVRCVSGSPDVSDPKRLTWSADNLAPGATRGFCANFMPTGAGMVNFAVTASAEKAEGVASSTETKVQAPTVEKTAGGN